MRVAPFAGLLLALSLGLSQPVAAADPPVGRGTGLFAAIAVDRADAAYGYGQDYTTRSGAERRALRECRRFSTTDGCRNVVWVRNGCAAVAVRQRADGRVTRMAWGLGASRTQAKFRAVSACQEDGRRCRALASVCTTG